MFDQNVISGNKIKQTFIVEDLGYLATILNFNFDVGGHYPQLQQSSIWTWQGDEPTLK